MNTTSPHLRARRVLATSAVLAVALPALAWCHATGEVRQELTPALQEVLGESVEIGSVEAALTGSVRIERIEIGGLVYADAIEGSVGLRSLLSGRFSADEIRIEGPRLRTQLDSRGESRLEQMLRRVLARRAHGQRSTGRERPPVAGRRLRRIIVTGGQLRVDLEGRGSFVVRDVELHPQRGGVRVIAAGLSADLLDERLTLHGHFDRAAADIALPGLKLQRAIAIGGELAVTPHGHETTRFQRVVLARGVAAPTRTVVTARASTQAGPARLRLELSPRADGGTAITVTGRQVPLGPLAALAPQFVSLERATASGTATITVRPTHSVNAELALELANLTITHPRVAAEPLEITGALNGTITTSHADGGQLVRWSDTLFAPTGQVSLRTDGELVFRGGQLPYSGTMQVTLPETSCMQALTAVPEPARRRLLGLDLRGTVKGHLALTFDGDAPEATELEILLSAGGCQASHEADNADPQRITEPFQHSFADGSKRTIGPGEPDYVAYAAIPPTLVGTFVAAEDARFWTHSGFDTHQIERSLAIDLAQGELVRGGSTISQQLVKNVFLERQRTFSRKFEEAVLTWRLEQRVGKRAIITTYLNIIELGPGIYGIEPAARYWFGKSLAALSHREVAFLAAMTPAPIGFSRRISENGKVDDVVAHRVDVTLRAARNAGILSDKDYKRALQAPLRVQGPLAHAR